MSVDKDYYSKQQYIIGISSSIMMVLGYENFVIPIVAIKYKYNL